VVDSYNRDSAAFTTAISGDHDRAGHAGAGSGVASVGESRIVQVSDAYNYGSDARNIAMSQVRAGSTEPETITTVALGALAMAVDRLADSIKDVTASALMQLQRSASDSK
jgi:hypothetical protein